MIRLWLELSSLTIYRELLDDPVMQDFLLLTSTREEKPTVQAYARVCHALYRSAAGNLSAYLRERILYSDSAYARLIAAGKQNTLLEDAARRDIMALNHLLEVPCTAFQVGPIKLPPWETGQPLDFDEITCFYQTHGCGKFARSRVFVWNHGELIPTQTSQEPLFGYERQRAEVEANTRAFVAGNFVNNVLLYGDSGTGKSATVKSLALNPAFPSLRIIEIPQAEVQAIGDMIRFIKDEPYYFILFIDDISFTNDEREFSNLKVVLEGGVESRPRNVVVYATSNRRNLVSETFSERAGDDVHASETRQSKLSLSDRFGIRIAYLPLEQSQYLALVEALAKRAGIGLPGETLRQEAIKWEQHHGRRTPRVANQFVDYLKSMGIGLTETC